MITEQEVKSKTIERFWSKIKFGEPDECWEWQRALSHGYGKIILKKDDKYIAYSATRIMYKSIFSEFNECLFVLHKCDNPKCVNPNHLWQGTHSDNMQDMVFKGRHGKVKALGSKNGMSKLTEVEVVEIRRRLSIRETQRSIAEIYGVERSIIADINSGKTWKHVITEYKQNTRIGKQKLDEDTVILIKQQLAKGIKQNKIAAEFNISPTHICDINSGKAKFWNYLN